MDLRTRRRASAVLAPCFALLLATPSAAATQSAHAGHALGTVHFSVSCSAKAQREFDDALGLLHHMTYPQARSAFAAVTAREPDCAMAHCGQRAPRQRIWRGAGRKFPPPARDPRPIARSCSSTQPQPSSTTRVTPPTGNA